jgi:hypothetical protein
MPDPAPTAPRRSWSELMPLYRDAHRRAGTRALHMVGIPLIVASLPLSAVRPIAAAGLFVAGWVCQLVGHFVFEKNDPQFFGDWRNLFVGVAWSGIEWAHLAGGIARRIARWSSGRSPRRRG